jgi:competence protein ComEC
LEKTFQNIPFLRLAVALAAGIIIGVKYAVNEALGLAILTLILFLLVVINKKYKFEYSLYFGTGVQLFFIWLGILITQHYNEKPEFYDKGRFVATILETPQEKPNSWKSVIQIKSVHYTDSVKHTNELVTAYFAKNEKVTKLKSGDIIQFRIAPQLITNNNNPYEFDYKKYLEQKRIYRQVYLTEENWTKTNNTKFSIVCQAERIRENLLEIYRNQRIDEIEFEILSALTLGYKRELDPETKRIFSSSGAMHVLAVSGLHVGIIFLAITLMFGFLRKFKSGRLLFIIVTISILWFYAIITGLSPSVMRASAMFSIFVIGQNLNRKPNIYNSLAASAFFLLLINPNNLFDTGFQLSYSAVFGIVFLQPKLEKIIFIKNRVFKYFWQLITVSIAAQIATFPITTYYFGQFPTYFWLANTFVIPAVMFLVPFGILLLFISKIHFLANILAIALNYTIKTIYYLLSTIEQLPYSVFEISVNSVQLIFIIIIVCAVLIFIMNYKTFYLHTTLVFTLLLSINALITEINRLNYNELIVYNTPKNPSIHLIHGKKNYIISEEKINEDEMHYFPAITTVRKLGLKHPVFLISSDTFTNGEIFLKNGFAFFEGKTIMLRKNLTTDNKGRLPDFIINPTNTEIFQNLNNPHTTVISNKRYINQDEMKIAKIHFITLQGAFRKKW